MRPQSSHFSQNKSYSLHHPQHIVNVNDTINTFDTSHVIVLIDVVDGVDTINAVASIDMIDIMDVRNMINIVVIDKDVCINREKETGSSMFITSRRILLFAEGTRRTCKEHANSDVYFAFNP